MIVAGFGFREAATVDSLADAYAQAGGAQLGATHAATAEDKATGVFTGFAEGTGLRVVPLSADLLSQQATPTQSQAARAARNVGSLAEAAALAAAGDGATLIAARVVSGDGRATCALARRAPQNKATAP